MTPLAAWALAALLLAAHQSMPVAHGGLALRVGYSGRSSC